MTNFFYSIILAFSFFSILPVPKIIWTDRRLKYVPLSMPLVGSVNGLLAFALFTILSNITISPVLKGIIMTLFFIIYTGALHIDGLMDSADAYFSRQNREKKLEILKDPHAGAFAIITLCFFILTKIMIFSEIFTQGLSNITIIIFIPILSRTIQALMLYVFLPARDEGLAKTFHSKSKMGAITLLVIFIIQCLFISILYGNLSLILPASLLIFTSLFYYSVKKNFGGITGDLLGAFLELSELILLILLLFI